MYCILIAGMPATGKSRFAEWLSIKRNLPYMSKDTIKEIMFDTVGFKSRAEKISLGVASMCFLYYFAESQMKINCPFIIENNFEDSSRQRIMELIHQYNYTPITILFDGKTEAIYNKFIERDQLPERHRGHVVNKEYPEAGQKEPYVPMSLDKFSASIEARGFRRFDIGGKMIKVDSTDFANVDYEKINATLNQKIYETF